MTLALALKAAAADLGDPRLTDWVEMLLAGNGTTPGLNPGASVLPASPLLETSFVIRETTQAPPHVVAA